MWNLDEAQRILDREMVRLKEVFEKVTFTGEDDNVWDLVLSYWEDCKYFYGKEDYVKAFELVNYIWGMLDALANLSLLKIPENLRKYFKIEQENP